MKLGKNRINKIIEEQKDSKEGYMKSLNLSDRTASGVMLMKDNIKEIKDFFMPITNDSKKYLVLGCVHVPFNNKQIMQGILKMLSRERFDGIILAGDFLDMGALSSYEKGKVNKSGVTLSEEYEEANNLLDMFDDLLPEDALKVFMFGNHCNRYYRWLSDVNNSKYGDIINPIENLKLKERGYEVYNDYANDIYKLGSLNIMHGEYYNIHCAKKHLDVFRRNILFFHTHRVQVHREGEFASYNGGFLGDKNSPAFNYAKRGMKSAWANAFAVVTLTEDEHFVNLINCINNKFEYNGVIY